MVAHALRAGEDGVVVGHHHARPAVDLADARRRARRRACARSAPRASAALLGGEQQRPVLDEGALVDEVGEVLARGAPPALAAARDRLGARRVEPDRVALAHRLAGRRARRRVGSSAGGARRRGRRSPPGAEQRRSSWPSSTASPTATSTLRDDAAGLREHLVLHLHRLEHDQRRARADLLVRAVRRSTTTTPANGAVTLCARRRGSRASQDHCAAASRTATRCERTAVAGSAALPSGDVRRRANAGLRAARGAQGGASRRPSACTRCPELAATRKTVVFGAGNADADLMFVGEAPGASEDEQGVPFVGRAGKLLETAARRDRTRARRRLHREHAEVPAPGQPRPAAGRDRELPGVPAAPGRADRADRHLHARQLLDEAAARRPDRDHAPARPAGGARRSAGARCGCIRSSIRRRRSTRRACSRRCARTSRGCRSCWRMGAPEQPPQHAAGALAERPRSAGARAGARAARTAPAAQQPRGRRSRPAGAVLDAVSDERSAVANVLPAKRGSSGSCRKISSARPKVRPDAADTGHVSIPPGVTTGPRPFLPRVGRFNGPAAVGSRVSTWPCAVVDTSDPAETEALGAELAASLRDGDVVLVRGELGLGQDDARARRRPRARRHRPGDEPDASASATATARARADRLAPRPLPPRGPRAGGPGAARRLPRARDGSRSSSGRRTASASSPARACACRSSHRGEDRRRDRGRRTPVIVLGFDTADAGDRRSACALARTAARCAARDDPAPGRASRPRHAAAGDGRRAARARRASAGASSSGSRSASGRAAFTGLRVGVATARGLAQSLDVELVGVSSLRGARRCAALAARAPTASAILAVIDARRGEVFAAGVLTRCASTDGAAGEPLRGASSPLRAGSPREPQVVARRRARRRARPPVAGGRRRGGALRGASCKRPASRSAAGGLAAAPRRRRARSASSARDAAPASRCERDRARLPAPPDAELALAGSRRRGGPVDHERAPRRQHARREPRPAGARSGGSAIPTCRR